MAWHRSIPAVLLLTLAVPAAEAKGAARAAAPIQAVCRVRGDRPSARTGGSSQPKLRRRSDETDQSAFSAETVTLAGQYLRSRADAVSPSVEARASWEQFYTRCDAAIRRFARTFRTRGVNVDDCTQEVWADLMTSLPDFRMDAARGRFTSWLYTIVRSKATDMMRRQARRPAASLSPVLASQLIATDPDPAAILEQKSDRESLRSAMAELRAVASESSYRVLHLRYIAGWDVQQVADALGFSREQVWVREHRMKRKLRGLLEPEFQAPLRLSAAPLPPQRETA